MNAYSNPRAYEHWMGRWSNRLAPHFVAFADLKPDARLVDVGSGTGMLAEAVLKAHPGVTVVGVEPEPTFVAFANEKRSGRGARFRAGSAQEIPFDDASFDAALALLVLQTLPSAPDGIAEMRRVTRLGGTVAATIWDFGAGMPMTGLFWEAVGDVIPGGAAARDRGRRAPFAYPTTDALAALWRDTGLSEVETAVLWIEMDFAGFDDYWTPFLGGATPTSSYAGTLPADTREAVRERLREKVLGQDADRGFTLPARAHAVRGVVA